MPKYSCCGMDFRSPKELGDHVKATHSAPAYRAELSCCGMDFNSATELRAHVRDVHKAARFDIEV